MTLFDIKVNSYVGADTRIQVVQVRPPKKERYLDRDSEFETKSLVEENGEDSDSPRTERLPRIRGSRLSTYAKASLQRIGGAVDSVHAPIESVFLTGTFPGDSFDSQRAISAQSAWIVHRLKAWIYKQIGASIGYHVWEFQKRGTLHLHYVVVVPCPMARAAIIEGFRGEWIRLIHGASLNSGCDLFVGRNGRNFFYEREKLQIYAQECHKSCAAYLSKYLGKRKYSRFPPPTRMWGCTKQARKIVASSLISVELCSKFLKDAEDFAYQLQSESDTPLDKQRFFRHRFSKGFTILLYNDTFRVQLSKLQETMVYSSKTSLYQKGSVLKAEIISSGAINGLKQSMTPVGWSGLSSLIAPESDLSPPFRAIDVAEGLIEARALIDGMGGLGYRAKFSLRNRLAVLITEIITEYDLSLLLSCDVDNCPDIRGEDSALRLDIAQSPSSQLRLL